MGGSAELEALARVLEHAANVLRLGEVEASLKGVRWAAELLERLPDIARGSA